MFSDARSLSPHTNLDADICVVGAGAAGITLARELIGSDIRVCVLESGGLELDADTQALARGKNVGLPYHPLDHMRLRYFGGTTGHWAGWCRPPRPFDFRPRSWIPHSGWPFAYGELESHLKRAHELLELGPFDYRPNHWADTPQRQPLRFTGGRVLTTITQFSPPTRFGRAYRAELERAVNISVWLHANALRFDLAEDGRGVKRLHAACLFGPNFSVTARHYVLAAGGIENARLLLESDHQQAGGLGNGTGLVGRYFMDHIKFQAGVFQPARQDAIPSFYQRHATRGLSIKGNLSFSEATLERERLPECYFEFAPSRPDAKYEQDHAPGRKASGGGMFASAALSPWSVILRLDPAPNPESRISLDEERDALGMRRVRLDWRFGELERRGFDRAARLLAEEISRSALGTMRVHVYDEHRWPPPPGIAVPTGFHHMGTTRMHRDPKQGVVNADCRVHGIGNLFIAGSSVFPNYEGYPTLTLVALALRLAAHLRSLPI